MGRFDRIGPALLGVERMRDKFQMNEMGFAWAETPCPKCRTKKEPKYQCRNLPSIGFYNGWVCVNCGHREVE